MKQVITFFVSMLCVFSACADWSGKGEAGLVVSNGNSETETGNAQVVIANEINDWKHTVGLAGLYASSAGTKTAQRWEVFGQSDYNFAPKTFAFGAIRYEDDEFSGFDSQMTLSGGIGRRFIESDPTNLVGTVGIGYKILQLADVENALGNVITRGDKDKEAILRGTLDYDHTLTETTKIINKFIVESGSSNTFAENSLSLEVKMNTRLALALGFTVRHNTEPPNGFDKTDRLTTLNLVYEI